MFFPQSKYKKNGVFNAFKLHCTTAANAFLTGTTLPYNLLMTFSFDLREWTFRPKWIPEIWKSRSGNNVLSLHTAYESG